MSKAITVKTEIDEEFLIEHNPKISRINNKTVTVLSNTAVSTGYSVMDASGQGNTIQFPIKTSETSFLDSSVRLEMKIPVIFTLDDDPTGAGVSDPYAAANYFNDAALNQFGLINAIDTIQLKLNGSVVSMVDAVYRKFPAIAQYYDATTALKLFPQSLPDSYTDYEHYTAQKVITSYDVDGNSIKMQSPQFYPLNIFESTNSYEFNSRRPYISNLNRVGRDITGDIILSTYIPFSIFSLPDSSSQSIYGVQDMNLQITLRHDYVKHLFGFKGHWDDVAFKTGGTAISKLYYKQFSPPSYVENNLIENGFIKPYRIALTDIMDPPSVSRHITTTQPATITSNQISVGSLPSRVYVYAVPKKVSGETDMTLPRYYGRIESLKVKVGSSTTIIENVERVYNTCIENDLNVQRDVGLYTNGFVACLDLSKDVGIGKDTLIGLNLPATLEIEAVVRNLSDTARDYDVYFTCIFPSQLVYNERKFVMMNTIMTDTAQYSEDNIVKRLYDGYDLTIEQPIIGGSIFSGLFRGLKNIGRYVVNNPEKVLNFARNAYKTITGSGQRQSNIIGGAETTSRTLLLGSGTTSGGIFK